jgi:hypothetical protein
MGIGTMPHRAALVEAGVGRRRLCSNCRGRIGSGATAARRGTERCSTAVAGSGGSTRGNGKPILQVTGLDSHRKRVQRRRDSGRQNGLQRGTSPVGEMQRLGSRACAPTRWSPSARGDSSGTRGGALGGDGVVVAMAEARGTMEKK